MTRGVRFSLVPSLVLPPPSLLTSTLVSLGEAASRRICCWCVRMMRLAMRHTLEEQKGGEKRGRIGCGVAEWDTRRNKEDRLREGVNVKMRAPSTMPAPTMPAPPSTTPAPC
eukprot:scaffold108494_cov20-Tisochrysis_lutea.AAC.1